VRFVETHPDEAQRIVANALETAAALDSTGTPVTRRLPAALQRLVISAGADSGAGRVLSISEAAERLKVTRVTVYAWIEAKRLLAAEQITGSGEVVPGIDRVLAVISEPTEAWEFLTEESPYLSPDELRRPIDALKAGEVDVVVAAAHSFIDAFT
jgi:excisionase family DNA binding protein